MGSDLQREIRQTRPFRSLEAEVMLNMTRTMHVLASEFATLFRNKGISDPQFNVLRILRGAGREGLPSLEVRERMVARVPDITRLVDRLETADLVERLRSDTDRRVVHVRITARGRRVLKALDEPVDRLHREQLEHLSREQLATLNELLVQARRRPEAAGPED